MKLVYRVPRSEFDRVEFTDDAEVTALPDYYAVTETYTQDPEDELGAEYFVSTDGHSIFPVAEVADPDNTHLVRVEFAYRDDYAGQHQDAVRRYNIAHHIASD
jgi:hypothetical protein